MAIVLPILGGLGAGVAGFFGFAIAATSLTAILIGGLIVVGAALLISKYATKGGQKDPGMLVNKNSNNDPIPVVYGERRVGATRTFMRSAGATGSSSSNEYLHIVYTICEGPIESIEKIYFNDYEVWDKTTGISSSAGEDNINFTGLLEITNHLGDQTTAETNLVSRFSSEWTANHVGYGIVYSYIRMKYDREAFSGLPTVTFLVRGRKVRDVDNLASAEAYSANPANVTYDYLTHPIYGRDFDRSLIDITSFQDAKDYYAVAHTYLGAPKYTCNGALATEENTYDNTQRILANCNRALVFSNGVYKLIPFKPTNSSDLINESHIVDNWSVMFGDKSSRFNTLRARFPNIDYDYQMGSIVVQNSTFKSDDNDLILQKEIGFDMIVDPDRAKLAAYELLLQSRYQTTIEVTLPHTKQTIEPMDVVTFEHPYMPDEMPTLYRVLGVQLKADGTLTVQLQEYNSSVYDEFDPSTL